MLMTVGLVSMFLRVLVVSLTDALQHRSRPYTDTAGAKNICAYQIQEGDLVELTPHALENLVIFHLLVYIRFLHFGLFNWLFALGIWTECSASNGEQNAILYVFYAVRYSNTFYYAGMRCDWQSHRWNG